MNIKGTVKIGLGDYERLMNVYKRHESATKLIQDSVSEQCGGCVIDLERVINVYKTILPRLDERVKFSNLDKFIEVNEENGEKQLCLFVVK